jgi:hypothetical protein
VLGGGKRRIVLTTAAAAVVLGLATNEAVLSGTPAVTLGLIGVAFVAALITTLATLGPAVTLSEGDAEDLVRKRSREHSLGQLGREDVLSKSIDELIPIVHGREGAPPLTVAALVEEAAALVPGLHWVVEGGPGCGKSTLLHRISDVLNRREDLPAAVVVPLATYDWEQDRFGGWLAAEVAQITGVKQSAVERLIGEQRLFVLLDGIDDVPNDVTLTEQALPDSELPIIDRRRGGRQAEKTNPRQKLISNLAKLPGFVLTARHGGLLEEERRHLSRYPGVRIEPIPPSGALEQLRARAPQLRGLVLSEAFAEVIRSPLYLRLAGGVCGEHGEIPDQQDGPAELEHWLWDRYLHYRLASREMQELGWEPAQFRRWLVHCAGALPLPQQALSLRRWPLLYPRAVRSALRLSRSALSGLLVALLALAFMKPYAAAVCGGICAGAFLFAGEGAATRPLAIQRFGARRFLHKAVAEGWYAVTFLVVGGALGLAIAEDPAEALSAPSGVSPAVAVGVGVLAGALLIAVPTLYELFYLDEAALYAPSYRDGAIAATAAAATVIGLVAGTVAAIALAVAFPTTSVLWAIPLAVVLGLLDTLGLPFAAVGLWTLQGRGPLDVGAFLTLADEIRVARRFGQNHFLEHSELQRFLAEEERTERRTPAAVRFRGLAIAGCGIAAVWLCAYSLIHLTSTLPSSYAAAHWRIAWVGFDLAMATVAVITLALLRRGVALAALPAAMLAAMLMCDGWFDCLTARAGDLAESLLSLGAELPAALFFLWVAVSALRNAVDDEVGTSARAS